MSIKKVFDENGWFPIFGEIKPKLVSDFIDYSVKAQDLKLLFNTGGGNIMSALAIVDLILLWKNLNKKPVRSFCIGECNSSGLTILSACDLLLRESAPNTIFFFHSSNYEAKIKHDNGLKKAIENVTKNWKLGIQTIKQESQGFSISKEKLLSLRKDGDTHGTFLTPQEMVKLKIISKITNAPSVL